MRRVGSHVDRRRALQFLAFIEVLPAFVLQPFDSGELAKASQVLEIVSHSYQEGATSLLELMDARRAHNQIHLAANQVRYAHRLAAIQLDLALGTPAP